MMTPPRLGSPAESYTFEADEEHRVEDEDDSSRPWRRARARMCAGGVLEEFWQFATGGPRTISQAAVWSARLRGAWLTEDLVVQRVHGWGSRAVRLLCVRGSTRDAQLERALQQYSENLAAGMVAPDDPLDLEEQVLVKIPYGSCLDGSVERECGVLRELAGLEGVPELAEQIFFVDIGVNAIAYVFGRAPSLQEQLRSGRLVPPEGLHKVSSFILRTLERAHGRGWLHTDLQPRDVLLAAGAGAGACAAPGLLCGWSRASRRRSVGPRAGLVDALEASQRKAAQADGGLAGAGSAAADAARCGEQDEGAEEAGGPSLLSAPEQLVGLFTGDPCGTEATDVFRAAAVVLVATCGRGPFEGSQSMRHLQVLRRLCQEMVMRRAEGTSAEAVRPAVQEVANFSISLGKLMAVRASGGALALAPPELQEWLQLALSGEPGQRLPNPAQALDALDDAWSRFEARLLEERRTHEPPVAAVRKRRPPIVLEPPPELLEMRVL